jgi:hypothetical protein
MSEYKITDWNYIMSTVGNAYFSNVSFDQLWNTVCITNNREEFDAAISSLITLNDLSMNNDHEET